MFGRYVVTVKAAHCSNKVLNLHITYDKAASDSTSTIFYQILFLVRFICMNMLFPNVDS